MELSKRECDGVTVLEVTGKILGGNDSAALDREMDGVIEAKGRGILLDLERVPWMNSSGLGILLAAFIRLREYGGVMKFLHVPDRVRAILVTTKLIDILEVHDDEKAAIDSFSAADRYESNRS